MPPLSPMSGPACSARRVRPGVSAPAHPPRRCTVGNDVPVRGQDGASSRPIRLDRGLDPARSVPIRAPGAPNDTVGRPVRVRGAATNRIVAPGESSAVIRRATRARSPSTSCRRLGVFGKHQAGRVVADLAADRTRAVLDSSERSPASRVLMRHEQGPKPGRAAPERGKPGMAGWGRARHGCSSSYARPGSTRATPRAIDHWERVRGADSRRRVGATPSRLVVSG
jgi:hypothetical protein